MWSATTQAPGCVCPTVYLGLLFLLPVSALGSLGEVLVWRGDAALSALLDDECRYRRALCSWDTSFLEVCDPMIRLAGEGSRLMTGFGEPSIAWSLGSHSW